MKFNFDIKHAAEQCRVETVKNRNMFTEIRKMFLKRQFYYPQLLSYAVCQAQCRMCVMCEHNLRRFSVQQNKPTLHIFHFILETRFVFCKHLKCEMLQSEDCCYLVVHHPACGVRN